MDLDLLREFLTLSEKLNFSETAKIHFIAQPALSRHIVQLEKELDTPLFYRNHQSVHLTEYGRIFVSRAQNILDEYEKAMHEIEAEKERLSSSISIAYIFDVLGNQIGKFFDTFLAEHPDVELRNDTIDAIMPTQTYLAENPNVDVVVNYICEPLAEEKFAIQELFSESLHLIVPETHPLSSRRSIRLDEIQGEQLIECAEFQHSFYREHVRAILSEAGASYIPSRDATSLKQSLVMVESGYGCTIAPWKEGRYQFARLRAIPITDSSCKVKVGAVWYVQNLNPNTQKLLDIFQF